MKCLIILVCYLALVSASYGAARAEKYPTSQGMDRKCLYLAKQMNRIIKKLDKKPIDERQLQQDLQDYQQEWLEHDCRNKGKNVR